MHDENLFTLILFRKQLKSNSKAPSMYFKANLVYRLEIELETFLKTTELSQLQKLLNLGIGQKYTLKTSDRRRLVIPCWTYGGPCIILALRKLPRNLHTSRVKIKLG